MSSIFPYIVADVGGTNGRFGLVSRIDSSSGCIKVQNQQVFPCSQFDLFEDLLAAYMEGLEIKPRAACISIAGPVTGDRFCMTNLHWDFSIEAVRKKLGLERLDLMNDFAALAYSALYLEPDELTVLQTGYPIANAPRIVIGPGTGLGVAGLIKVKGRWYPIPGEGGHTTFAPTSQKQLAIKKVIESSDRHISTERFVSGTGLSKIHQALAIINDQEAMTQEAATQEPRTREHGSQEQSTKQRLLSPSEISQRAINGTDPLCAEALDVFFEMLGNAAGNVCMTFGAWGGVYLGGGILPKLEKALMASSLLANFKDKGRMGELLKNVPVSLMKGDRFALTGAAHWLIDEHSAGE